MGFEPIASTKVDDLPINLPAHKEVWTHPHLQASLVNACCNSVYFAFFLDVCHFATYHNV